MTNETPAHDSLRPRLAALVQQAIHAGFSRETVVAVITDLITTPPFNAPPAAPPPE